MSKGGRYERKYARVLSNWITENSDDTQLVRSKQSGGWSRKKYRQAGDLAANGSIGRKFRKVFIVEIKARDSFELRHIWSSDSPKISEWWEKVWGEAEEFQLVPLLIYDKPYHPTLVGLPTSLVRRLWPESRYVIVEWGALERPAIGLVEIDELTAMDPDLVLDHGKQYIQERYD